MDEHEQRAERKNILITVPKRNCKRLRSKQGREFWRIWVPAGVMVAGAMEFDGNQRLQATDIGGYTFSPLYVSESSYSEDLMVIPCQPQKEIWLEHSTKKPDGTWVRDDQIKVMPAILKSALSSKAMTQGRERKHQGDGRVRVSLPQGNVLSYASSEGKVFNKAWIPSGTTLEGDHGAATVDGEPIEGSICLDGFYFNPLFVNSADAAGNVEVPLMANKPVWLKRDVTDGAGAYVKTSRGTTKKEVVVIMPDKLETALRARAERAAAERGQEPLRRREPSQERKPHVTAAMRSPFSPVITREEYLDLPESIRTGRYSPQETGRLMDRVFGEPSEERPAPTRGTPRAH